MTMFCCVLHCSASSSDNVRFFRIPNALSYKHRTDLNELSARRRQKWIEAINRIDFTESKIKFALVCSRHFIDGKPAKLEDEQNQDWVPSVNMGFDNIGPVKDRQNDSKKEMAKIISTSLCLICDASCLSVRNSIPIFSKGLNSTDLDLQAALRQLLDREVEEGTMHAGVVCKKCYKLIDEFDELQSRINNIKKEVLGNYERTIDNRVGTTDGSKANKTDKETNDSEIQTDNVGEHVKAGDESDSKDVPPKKILDIPSSDDESNEMADKQLDTLEDIEVALGRMHGDGEETTHDMDTESASQSFKSDENSDSDDDLEMTLDGSDKNKLIKLTVESNEDLSGQSDATASDSVGKPNILRKNPPQTRVGQKNNIIIQETADKPDNVDDETQAPLVSRSGNIYTCLLCVGDETVAGDARGITSHIKDQHNERVYICDVCGMDFRKRNLLSAHVDEHVVNEEGDFQCETCNRIFNNLRLFRIHRRVHFPEAKAWECSKCGKRYNSKNLLEQHMNGHLGVRPYVCGECGKDFTSKYTFKAHEKTHVNRQRKFRCEQCDKTFFTQQNLTQHEKTHVKEYQCHLCHKQFATVHNLEVHSIVHTSYRPYVCRKCGKSFARKAEVRDHERTHTGERPFQCEFCGATFSQRSNLQSHKRATHYDDKRYKCDICEKGFKRRRLLDYHIKAAHTGERPYKCETCDTTFVYPEHFKKHRRIHTGEKPYVCEVCGKAFNSRDNRNAHRFVHSDKKPYECLTCGAGFMRKPLLYQHMQTQGHLNDTIVINQPRLTLDDNSTMDSDIQLVSVGDNEITESKVELVEEEDGTEHIIIDGRAVKIVHESEENEEGGEEMAEEIQQLLASEDGDFEESLSAEALAASETQIIDTPEGPIQLVKVRIPNENGEEEEAWIKIVSE